MYFNSMDGQYNGETSAFITKTITERKIWKRLDMKGMKELWGFGSTWKHYTKMNEDDSCFGGMSHDQILDAIRYGLHYLTTTELVNLHADISEVQLKRTHVQEEMKKDG